MEQVNSISLESPSSPETERGTPDQYAAQMILLATTDKLIDTILLEYNLFKDVVQLNRISGQASWNRNPYAIINDSQLRRQFAESRKFCLGKISFLTPDLDFFLNEISIKFPMGGNLKKPESYEIDDSSFIEKLYHQADFKEKVIKIWPELSNVSDYVILEKLIKELNEDFNREVPVTGELFPPFIFAEMAQQIRLSYFCDNPHLQKINPKKGDVVGKLNFELSSLPDLLKITGKLAGNVALTDWERGYANDVLFKDRCAYTFEKEKKINFETGLHLEIKHPGSTKVLTPLKSFSPRTLRSGGFWEKDSNEAIILEPAEGFSRHETQELAYFLSNDLIRIPRAVSPISKSNPANFSIETTSFSFITAYLAATCWKVKSNKTRC